MFKHFDETTIAIIEKAKEYSKSRFKLGKIGTEAFLYVMFNDEDSLCRILLEEYRVSLLEIEDLMRDYIIIRSNNNEYTEKLKEVFQTAELIARENGVEKVFEEHLFFALLMVKNTIFIDTINRLNLNPLTLLEDLKNYFNLNIGKEIDNYSLNLTKLAKEGKLNSLIGREDYLKRMEIILKRKNKNNILLVGSAGVGKTALVEGLAIKLLNEEQILSINVASIVANTKYRGDFESRINKILEEFVEKDTILFIDEIHTIMGAGSTDNNLDLANILKPYLARNNFRCIGATTIEEYQKTIYKDKALARRFQPIFINEPTLKETQEILKGIKKDFLDFHQVDMEDDKVEYIVSLAEKIANRKFPDKAIDLLDEALSIAKINQAKSLTISHVDKAFENISGLVKGDLSYEYLYKELEPFYIDNYLGIKERNNLATIKFVGDDTNLALLLKELSRGFGIPNEMILDLDLTEFTEAFSISSLFGAPAGYVGYEEGGIISEHLAKYPAQIMVLRNLQNAHPEIRQIIDKMLSDKTIYDKKGRQLATNHAVFVVAEPLEDRCNMGFIKEEKRFKNEYALLLENKISCQKENAYGDFLNSHGFRINYDESSYQAHPLEYKKTFIDLIEKYEKGNYQLNFDAKLKQIEIKRL